MGVFCINAVFDFLGLSFWFGKSMFWRPTLKISCTRLLHRSQAMQLVYAIQEQKSSNARALGTVLGNTKGGGLGSSDKNWVLEGNAGAPWTARLGLRYLDTPSTLAAARLGPSFHCLSTPQYAPWKSRPINNLRGLPSFIVTRHRLTGQPQVPSRESLTQSQIRIS